MDETTFLFLIIPVCLLCDRTSPVTVILCYAFYYTALAAVFTLTSYIRIFPNWQYSVWLVNAIIHHAREKNGTINPVSPLPLRPLRRIY